MAITLPILDIPKLELAAGEQVVLRGRSGCGKTTLLNCISGLTTADEGKIVISGTDIVKLPEVARDRFRARFIGFVFQTFNLLPAFTALENVMLGMTFTGQKTNSGRAEKLLADVGLSHRLTHKPSGPVGRRATACCRRTGPGQPAQTTARRRTNRQRRPGASAAGNRPAAQSLRRRKCCHAASDAFARGVEAVRSHRAVGRGESRGGDGGDLRFFLRFFGGLWAGTPQLAGRGFSTHVFRLSIINLTSNIPPMSFWKIAWRNMQQRALASSLTGLSMALGVALMILVIVIHQVTVDQFGRDAQGYHLIVGGSKGGDMQLVMNTVFHLGQAIYPIPYKHYTDFVDGKYAQYTKAAVPYCIGDSYHKDGHKFRVIATTPDLFDKIAYGADDEGNDKRYEFSSGRQF